YSSDGLTWTKQNNNAPSDSDTTSTDGRIPRGTSNTADDAAAYVPVVLLDGSTYKMWYGTSDGSKVRIAYATSSDALNWTKYDNSVYNVSSGDGYAEKIISATDLSGYDYITAWVYANNTGNIVTLGFGENTSNEHYQSFHVDTINTWQKVYWDITAIPKEERDQVRLIRVTSESNANTVIFDNIAAEKFLNNPDGSTITSSPNEYIQYRAIMTTTQPTNPPKLYNVQLDWNNGYKVEQTDGNTVKLYNFTGESQDLRLDVIVFGADLAEYYTVNDQSIEAGDLVAMTGELDDYSVPILRKSNKADDPQLIGAISTKAGQTLGIEADDRRLLGLAGRIPVKVASDSAAIQVGDSITSSAVPGLAKKAEAGEMTIGKALENWIPDSDKSTVLMLISDARPLQTGYPITKLSQMKMVSVGSLNQTVKNFTDVKYAIQIDGNELVDQTSAFSQAMIANLQSGFIDAQEITTKYLSTNILQVNEKIVSPVIETTDLIASGTAKLNIAEVNTIKPQPNTDLTVDLSNLNDTSKVSSGAGELAKLVIKGFEGKSVATFDSYGNASFSGTLTAENITAQNATISGNLIAEEASISGKLTAKEIEAENIRFMEEQLNQNASASSTLADNYSSLSTNVNDIQKLLADIKNQPLPDVDYYQNNIGEDLNTNSQSTGSGDLNQFSNLIVSEDTNLYNLSVSNNFTAGNVMIEGNTIIGLSSELRLTALSSINFFDGAVAIAKDGTITTIGTLIAQGGVKTNEISALNQGEDININLGENNQLETSNDNPNSKLKIQNVLGEEVASIDASGSAEFNNLAINSLTINNVSTNSAVIAASDNFDRNGLYAPALETKAEVAGIGLIPQNQQEIIVYNDKVKTGSLIYITPTDDLAGSQMTVVKKESCETAAYSCRPYFKVAVSQTVPKDTKFNWLIIN
ncbi:hypothetical protein GYA28_05025, partial [Candidatus Roizmanbacteria bacterium]|nr:hypothetical protein [Candidatus Roizmanbacteria bacterium]